MKPSIIPFFCGAAIGIGVYVMISQDKSINDLKNSVTNLSNKLMEKFKVNNKENSN